MICYKINTCIRYLGISTWKHLTLSLLQTNFLKCRRFNVQTKKTMFTQLNETQQNITKIYFGASLSSMVTFICLFSYQVSNKYCRNLNGFIIHLQTSLCYLVRKIGKMHIHDISIYLTITLTLNMNTNCTRFKVYIYSSVNADPVFDRAPLHGYLILYVLHHCGLKKYLIIFII